jgi:hypothetical protein
LVASLGVLHPQILALEVVLFKGGRSVLTYAFVALLVMASAAELLVRDNAIVRRRVNVLAAVVLPLAYLAVIAAAILG